MIDVIRGAVPLTLFLLYFVPPILYLFWRLVFGTYIDLFLGLGPTPKFLNRVASDIEDPRLPDSPLQVVRWQLVGFLAGVAENGLWPASTLAGRTLSTVTPRSERALRPGLALYAAVCMVLGIILLLLRAAAGPSFGIDFVAFALLITLAARHLAWLASGVEFPRLLRRSLGNPYTTLIQLTIFDFAALLAVAVVLLRWHRGMDFQFFWLPAEARDLFSLRHITDLRTRSDLSPALVAASLAVTAYWSSVVRQLLRVTSFRRDDDDRVVVAAMLLEEGRIGECEKWLSTVDKERLTGPLLRLQMRLAIHRSDLPDGLRVAKAFALLTDSKDATVDGSYVYLAVQCRRMSTTDNAWRLIELAVHGGASDGSIVVVLIELQRTVKLFEGRSYSYNAEEGSYKKLESEQGLTSIAKAAQLGIERRHRPLAWSYVQGTRLEYEEVARTLQGLRPTALTDQIVAIVMLINMLRDGLRRTSHDDTQEQLSQLLGSLRGAPIEEQPQWLRSFVMEKTMELEYDARRFELPEQEELRQLRRRTLRMSAAQSERRLREFDEEQWEIMRQSRTAVEIMTGR